MSKKKKIIGILFLVFIAGSLVFLGSEIINKKEIERKVKVNTMTLSEVAKAIPLSLNEFYKPSLLIYMNSECEHCQWQLQEILKIEKSLAGTQVILVSFEPLDSLNAFLAGVPFRKKNLFKTYNIHPEKVNEVFGSSVVPQIFIYQKNQLVKYFRGETKVKLISELLDN